MSSEITTPTLNSKSRIYLMGVLAGALFGLAAAVLYSRAAEEEIARSGKPQQIPTTALIGLLLSALGLARQIAEAGKPRK